MLKKNLRRNLGQVGPGFGEKIGNGFSYEAFKQRGKNGALSTGGVKHPPLSQKTVTGFTCRLKTFPYCLPFPFFIQFYWTIAQLGIIPEFKPI